MSVFYELLIILVLSYCSWMQKLLKYSNVKELFFILLLLVDIIVFGFLSQDQHKNMIHLLIKRFIFLFSAIHRTLLVHMTLTQSQDIMDLNSKLNKIITVISTCSIHPTSAGSQMYVFPLNCWASVVTPFLIVNHRKEQGTVAVISLEV